MAFGRKMRNFLVLAALAALAGCESVRMNKEDVLGNPTTGYVKDPEIIVATTDWTNAQSVNLVCKDYSIEPHALSFEQGRPYRLRLSNPDEHGYYFTGEDFFRSIAVQKLVSPESESTFPYYEAIMLLPGEGKDLYFVPVEDGIYEAECSTMWNAILENAAELTVARSESFAVANATASAPATAEAESLQKGESLDPKLRARDLVMNNIRTANRDELEAIKTDLSRMQELVEKREAELDAVGE